MFMCECMCDCVSVCVYLWLLCLWMSICWACVHNSMTCMGLLSLVFCSFSAFWLAFWFEFFFIPFRFSRVPIPFSDNGTFIGYECVIAIMWRWVVWCHFYSRYWRMPEHSTTQRIHKHARVTVCVRSAHSSSILRTHSATIYNIHTIRIGFRLTVINFFK